MRLVLILLLSLAFLHSHAQEEFIVGKSANTLKRGNVVFSGEYSVFAFENIRPKRAGLDIAYGINDRLTVSLRGSASNFTSSSLDLETGSATAIYQLGTYNSLPRKWTMAPFAQYSIISRSAQVPGDINLDAHSSGFALGMIVNRNFTSLTVSGSLAYSKISFPLFIDGLLEGHSLLYQLSAKKSANLNFDGTELTVGLIGELTGQLSTEQKKDGVTIFDQGAHLDLLGGLQFTLEKQYRLELGLQAELVGNTNRFSEGFYHIKFKYMIW